ncbi:MAG: DUF4380 domain-containing protein [Opitutaceae bacterium]|jgi:hypothetical protein|nr:DUF4380 domain-containing protein [Opitutaceae bacterium]
MNMGADSDNLIKVGVGRPGLVATVAVARGGRTVGLHFAGGENLTDPGATDWAVACPDAARADAEWAQDFGQVVWLGPQSRFWSDQTAIPGRAPEAAGWPPDPVCVHGAYTVEERTPERLVLRGPDSPVWQVRLTKTWEALPDGSVRFSTEARNVSEKPIRKGLWFNFRAPPASRVLVPVESSDACRVTGAADLRLRFADGWLELGAPEVPTGADSTEAKAFIQPLRGVIRIEAAGGWLELIFPATSPDAVAEGQAPVEIYRKTARDVRSILEVEQHAPCVTLAPGAAMRHEEVWRWVAGA